MDMQDNPVLSQGSNPPWNYSETPRQQSPLVPPEIRRIVADIGLRFPITSQTDSEAHARRLALLASDLRDMPPDVLQQAVERYVRIPGKNFLPKASELVDIGKAIISERLKPENRGAYGSPEFLAQANARLTRNDVEWVYDKAGNLQLRPIEKPICFDVHGNRRPTGPLTDAEIRKMPAWIISLGVTVGDLDAEHCARIRAA